MAKVQFYTHAPITTPNGKAGEAIIAEVIRRDTNYVAKKVIGGLFEDEAQELWDDKPSKAEVDDMATYRVTVERLDNDTFEPVVTEGHDVV